MPIDVLDERSQALGHKVDEITHSPGKWAVNSWIATPLCVHDLVIVKTVSERVGATCHGAHNSLPYSAGIWRRLGMHWLLNLALFRVLLDHDMLEEIQSARSITDPLNPAYPILSYHSLHSVKETIGQSGRVLRNAVPQRFEHRTKWLLDIFRTQIICERLTSKRKSLDLLLEHFHLGRFQSMFMSERTLKSADTITHDRAQQKRLHLFLRLPECFKAVRVRLRYLPL
jgi:hypothetical protein